jgi:hypothetical protein
MKRTAIAAMAILLLAVGLLFAGKIMPFQRSICNYGQNCTRSPMSNIMRYNLSIFTVTIPYNSTFDEISPTVSGFQINGTAALFEVHPAQTASNLSAGQLLEDQNAAADYSAITSTSGANATIYRVFRRSLRINATFFKTQHCFNITMPVFSNDTPSLPNFAKNTNMTAMLQRMNITALRNTFTNKTICLAQKMPTIHKYMIYQIIEEPLQTANLSEGTYYVINGGQP